MLPFTYSLEGRITDVHRDQARTWRQDPGRPVRPEITRITGLTDEDLAGQAIDVAAATALIANSGLIVAHTQHCLPMIGMGEQRTSLAQFN